MLTRPRKKRLKKAGRDVVPSHTPAAVPAPGRHVVVAIGIDRYQHWRRLHNAVSDAEGATRLFKRLGFEEVIPPLLDSAATRDALESLVGGALARHLTSNDSLVVFYAGHGGVRAQQVGRHDVCTGYLIPVDAADERGDVTSWLELEPWLRKISRLPAKHILVILDACNSGIALTSIKWGRGGGLPDLPFATANTKQSRVIIASTLADERAMDDGPVAGHSLFTGCLLEALMGGAQHVGERDGRQVTIGSELGRYVRHRVQGYPGRPGWQQTPDFGTFDYDDRGEMLIPMLHGDAAAPSVVLARGSAGAIERLAPVAEAAVVQAPRDAESADATRSVSTVALPGATSHVVESHQRRTSELGGVKRAAVAVFGVLLAGVAYHQGGTAVDDGASSGQASVEVDAAVDAPPEDQAMIAPLLAMIAPSDVRTVSIDRPPASSATAPGSSATTPGSSVTAPGSSVTTPGSKGIAPDAPGRAAPPPSAGRKATRVASAPSPLAVAAPAGCSAWVESPRGAQVTWGDMTKEVPAELPLPCGVEVVLTFRRDRYYDRIKSVTVESARHVVKTQMRRVVTSVHVTSVPPGATITVGGARPEIKPTPADIELPEFERSTVTIRKDGYEPFTTKILPDADGVRIDVTLIKPASRSPAKPWP